jgi:hypothetical protein
MLATAEGEMVGVMSFASVTDAVSVAIAEWNARARNIVRLLFTRF